MILEKGTMETKKYVVVKNHVREIVEKKNESEDSAKSEESKKIDENTPKRFEKTQKEQTSSEQDKDISGDDLQELMSAYNNCKLIISKIETKYGHLLNLNNNEIQCDSSMKRKYRYNQCSCISNKKLKFDDNGEPHYDNSAINHICGNKQSPNNYQSPYRQSSYNYYHGRSHVQVENDNYYELPKTLCELGELLKDQSIHANLRYRIIQQMKYMRQENLSIIKYDKKYMVQKLKYNPDEYFHFEGSNLSTLEGYPE